MIHSTTSFFEHFGHSFQLCGSVIRSGYVVRLFGPVICSGHATRSCGPVCHTAVAFQLSLRTLPPSSRRKFPDPFPCVEPCLLALSSLACSCLLATQVSVLFFLRRGLNEYLIPFVLLATQVFGLFSLRRALCVLSVCSCLLATQVSEPFTLRRALSARHV